MSSQAKIITCYAWRDEIISDLKERIAVQVKAGKRAPNLQVILPTNDFASQRYVNQKISLAERCGIKSKVIAREFASETDLYREIAKANANPETDGLLVQFPLPTGFSKQNLIQHFDPNRDVDGLAPIHIGRNCSKLPGIVACTPQAIMYILSKMNYSLVGKTVAIIGASRIVGRPLSITMLNAGATTIVINKNTLNPQPLIKTADVVVVAIGQSRWLKADQIKAGAVVIDVGINRDNKNQLSGDCDTSDLKSQASCITAVPGGVGLLTVAMLLKNCYQLYCQHLKIN